MRFLKRVGLLAVAAASLTAFVGNASATITSPAGTKYNGTLKASSTNISIDGSVPIACKRSTIESTVSNGATSGSVTALTFSECGGDTMVTLKKGYVSESSNGNTTAHGMEVTVTRHATIIGWPITTHCIYGGETFPLGTMTEGVAPAVIHIGTAPLPEKPTDALCGGDATLTGTYTVSTPASAITID